MSLLTINMKLREKLLKIKESKKFKALFNDITPLEYLLICIPFIISFVSGKFVSPGYFMFAFLAISVIFLFGVLFLIGIRWRILFFVLLLTIGILIILVVGKPFEHWMESDRDEEIRNCIEAILNGNNPYKTITHLHLSPSKLPFTYFLYMPVYLITGGYTYYMHLIVLIIFCSVIFYKFIDTKNAYLIFPVIAFLIFSDFFILEAAMQSDMVTLQLFLCIILFLIPDEVPEQKRFLKVISIVPVEPKKIDKKIIIFAILFGSLMASRMSFWLIGAIVIFYLFKIYGLKNTLILGIIMIGTFAAWILPFMLMDIDYFFNVAPLAHNAKMAVWKDSSEFLFPGNIIADFIIKNFHYGEGNSVIITILIVIVSLSLGLIKLKNKFHLLVNISICFLIFLFFYLFIPSQLLRDYVSLLGVPFIFAFLYVDYEKNKEIIKETN